MLRFVFLQKSILEQVVLQEINRLTQFADRCKNDFVKAIIGHSAKVAENDRARKQRELDSLTARDNELDVLFERLYEDNVAGKIDDARFAKMSKRYEEEQGGNTGKIKILKAKLKKSGAGQVTTDLFLDTIRRYTRVKELTQRMVTALIDDIDVYHAEKDRNGLTTQQIVVHYNGIGMFVVPDRKNIPEVDVLMETGKGVAVCYSPARIA